MYTKIENIKVVGVAATVSNNWQSLFDASEEEPELYLNIIKGKIK